MRNETYITQNENGSYVLVNGNAETSETWEDYEDAKTALRNENNLDDETETVLEWIA